MNAASQIEQLSEKIIPRCEGTHLIVVFNKADLIEDKQKENAIRGCVACGQCSKLGHCVFNDLVNEVATKFAEADGLVVGSPVYYALSLIHI